MSEIPRLDTETYEEWQKRINVRRAKLEPALAQLAIKAKAIYSTLRPLARHVGDVERDYPLRHQQVRGMGAKGPAGVVADYLMIAFGGNHDLTLYRHYAQDRGFLWQFERSLLLEELLSEQTKVTELAVPRRQNYGGGVMDIEVAIYRYPEKVGFNPMIVDGVCEENNNLKDAEEFIDRFATDVDEAVEKFSE